ncbi:c-type cytochrome [Roseovarius sp. ZX-A-9]|uniref:c-type cytochrome n=1 Tax=Roseovarius sp. ZX-A-9 TaxID=3014783 RepID=UPI00232BF99E|nr:c-type cytochrome [Roseovarius sp. ZX-A-9]
MKSVLFTLVASVCIAGSAAAETPLERGRYLVQGPMGCGNCHTPKGPVGPIANMEMAGGFVIAMPEFTVHVPNISPGSRVAGWSDAELALAIREGIRPDGSVIRPPMAIEFYRHISDTDLAAIVAYLRSLPAVEQAVPESIYHIPVPSSYGPPVGSVPDVPHTVSVEYGKYLATVAHCLECHTPLGPEGHLFETDLGRGGREFEGPWGISVAPNLTNSPDGLAGYTDAELGMMITQGKHPDGRTMLPPMPYGYFANITPEDLAAIILYLRTVPPLPDAG